jgi:hypothetical protein
MEKKLTELIDKALTRRSFMARSGAAAAVAVVAGCGGGTATPPVTPTPTPTPAPPVVLGDSDYLNFALNLEYLEAEYEIAQNELDHVRFLRSALGSAAVPRPQIDLMNSFNAAASAAGIGASFNPFASYEAFLVGAFVFEDVGVTAYEGAAALLTSKTYLAAAVAIHNVEAYHAGEIRTLLIADSVANATMTSTMVSPNNTYVTYAQQISALRATLGGGKETPPTPLPPYAIPFVPTAYTPASSIVACDAKNSQCYARTTDEVLHIVYAAAPGAGVKGGGFFPNGMNGNISVTTS